ncbi:MAG: double-strand break repair protein AddB [Gemmobacter sp.]|nr:double-strand break repair protein AddB [Gemmobacter sp.]
MFDTPGPRVLGLAPGVDFPAALVAGLRTRVKTPEAMARVTLYVNTARMRRRIVEIFAAEGAGLLPRIKLVTDIAETMPIACLPPLTPPLRRRLELAQLISRLLEAQPDIAPRAALYDLSDSLAELMDEMQGEGVPPETIAALDVSDHSAHWKRTQDFLTIVAPFFATPTDAESRRRAMVQRLSSVWGDAPPADPVIVAGSTGSRGTTALLMQAVARLPQGAIVLPGFDFDMPDSVWGGLADALTAEDHPQFRFHRMLTALDLGPGDVAPWHDTPAPDAARNRLVSLSLRPAPVTDQWLSEGQNLPDLRSATQTMTLIEAASPRQEALAIALILRNAAEMGQKAALISPDRGLTRQVTAALDRWGIVPDDSAGRPLALSPPGRLLRQVSALFGRRLMSDGLLALLKHPLVHSGADRGAHLLNTRELELHLRRYGPAFPDAQMLRAWGAANKAAAWADWLAGLLGGLEAISERPLHAHVTHHVTLTEALSQGAGEGTGGLWLREAGTEARAVMDNLRDEAPHGGVLTPADYDDLFTALLNTGEVRETLTPHPGVMIWGTLEARVQGADLVILGSLNDGVWPQLPPPDPWLNRQMRLKAGLLLPERRIGLAAHDYQQAIAAPNVILTRAKRNDEAEAVPSRWLNRLLNLMQGLPSRDGPAAVTAMTARGDHWLSLARALESPQTVSERAKRPAPSPPLAVRPRQLAVTQIERLIRDPYAIYARTVLRLFPLNPLRQAPDARMRGSTLHRIMENFARLRADAPDRREALMQAAREVLEQDVPWPAARQLWQARLARVADWFLALDAAEGGRPVLLETAGSVMIPALGFTLTARPDRIDELEDGRIHIFDYKTGSPPSKEQIRSFDKQLSLQSAMAARGGFKVAGFATVGAATYIGLGSNPKTTPVDVSPEATDKVWAELELLLAAYADRSKGYVSRRATFKDRFAGDYDHLARYGEWEMSDHPTIESVGPEGTE